VSTKKQTLLSLTQAQAAERKPERKPESEPVLEALIDLVERGFIPDFMVRLGIRRLCRERLATYTGLDARDVQELESQYYADLVSSPVAVNTSDANRQHYELPPEFFDLVLGKHKKYSCAFWPYGVKSLDEAEYQALEATIERAELKDGMSILELGCGWGSLTLAMASRFPASKIISLSNSQPQRTYIEGKLHERGLTNVRVLTRNIVETDNLAAEFGAFDRVVSVEMFEHLRNYETLFSRIGSWLKPDGKLFTHIFTHREYSYFFDADGTDNWMGKYFFTGGQMPSRYLFRSFQRDLTLQKQWTWNGAHYAKTAEAWLQNIDYHEAKVLKIMERTYGVAEAERWLQRWRVFFLACAELFGFDSGNEWFVSHYLFTNSGNTQSAKAPYE
jgi:cyclopropane-fatty-acyl-phospholipid synthase